MRTVAFVPQDATNELFRSVEDLIREVVKKFVYKYRLDQEELMGTAHEIFMRAHDTYSTGKGSFEKWLKFLLWKILFEKHVRRPAMRHARTPIRHAEMDLTAAPTEFNMVDFIDGLSDDAQVVMSLVVDAPFDIALFMGRDTSPQSHRNAIKELLAEYGWTLDRITESFLEIRQAL